ncbi:putative spermidine/putrescine transport system substrate-binding protein [Rhizobiales bacterium GAS191]|nr:putative spermidine/putrescine transport system substrate-binding protein [Rhizobiales bacterium GAS191]
MRYSDRLSRRSLLGGLGAGAAALAAPPSIGSAVAEAKRLVIRALGIGSSFAEAYGKPFTEATGIEVVPVTGQNEPLGFMKQMVETKTYTWDMSIVSKQIADQLASDGGGYLEPLRLEGATGFQALPDIFKTSYYAANDVVGTVLGYRKTVVKRPPTSWADLWNVTEFPGRRALGKFPSDTLTQALLADGVDPKALYPIDFDRAFKSLDRIRKDVAVWWGSGAQSSQLLQSGEVDFCPTWNGRAQVAINAGAPVAIMWEQQFWQTEGWVIPKGSPNADLCRKFIAFALDPRRQAVFASKTGYGPSLGAAAIAHVDSAIAVTLPTHPDNAKTAILIDVGCWARVKDMANDRFNKWLLG